MRLMFNDIEPNSINKNTVQGECYLNYAAGRASFKTESELLTTE